MGFPEYDELMIRFGCFEEERKGRQGVTYIREPLNGIQKFPPIAQITTVSKRLCVKCVCVDDKFK